MFLHWAQNKNKLTNKYSNILSTFLLALTMVVVLISCSDKEDMNAENEHHPIAFSSVEAELETITRSGSTLGRNFVVYGYKNVNGNEQTVFSGYTVKYEEGSANTSEDNTHDYSYVDGEQTLKYWDLSASEYHFWGLWTQNSGLASFSEAKSNKITIPNVPLRTGEPDPEDDVLYSSLVERKPVSTDVVQLKYNRPYAKVRIQFYTSETIENESDNISLKDITFAPDPTAVTPLVNKVYGKGDVIVTYPLTTSCEGNAKEKVTLSNLSSERDALLFKDVTLTPTLGISSDKAVTAPIDDSDGFRLDDMPGSSLKAKQRKAGEQPGIKYFYYPLPMDDLNPAFIMKVRINGDSELKTAVVPANFMHWKPNFLYTYIFKITEAGKKIEFYDVQIDPWKYGGSQDEEWKNW